MPVVAVSPTFSAPYPRPNAAQRGGDQGEVRNELESRSSAAEPTSATAEPASAEVSEQQSISERVVVQRLAARDRQVRAHEFAHLSVAGALATSGPNYSYQIGPDGRRYAVGGEVGIDTGKVADDPAATIAKAQRVRAAALAPADPSAQDLRIAAQATQMESEARVELARRQREAEEYTRTAAAEDVRAGRLSAFA